ncbi:MAG: hypothetical protein ABI995_10300 [Acidobacteriota bacterium]
MSLVSEAIARYHKLIESEPYIDLAWAHALQERIQAEKLDGRPVSPVLRPHFITKRDYAALVKTSEILLSALSRMEKMVLATPSLLSRTQLLPAERMLAAVDPGYSLNISSVLDAALTEKSLRIGEHRSEVPAGVLHGDALADLYFESPPVKEFRKKHKLKKLGGTKPLLSAILKAYKEFKGKQKRPNIAIVEARLPFQSSVSSHAMLAEYFTREGYPTHIVSPEQLEYRNNVLRAGDFTIDIVFRRVRLQEFLVRYDLNHPLIRAYKDHAICMVNNFRADVGSKRVMFDLLTDAKLTAKFPAAERNAIKEHLPWTRLVQAAKTTHKTHTVDLPEFVMKHRHKLVLRPNDDASEIHPVYGAQVDDATWEKALRQAMRTPFVVQEAVEPARAVFPLMQYGSLMMKDMVTHVHPHAFGGSVHGASCWLGVAGSPGFTTLSGLAPTFLLEGK